MSSAPPTGPAAPAPNKTDPFFDSIRRIGLWRTDDRWFGGVAAGIAHRLGIDPLIVRGLFVLFTLIAGVGVLVYGLCWLLLPEASDGRIHLQQAFRGDISAGFIGALITIIFGVGRPALGFGWWGWGGHSNWLWGFVLSGLVVAAVIAVVAIVLTRSAQVRGQGAAQQGTHTAGPVPTPSPTSAATSGMDPSAASAGPVPPPGFRVSPLSTPPSGGTTSAPTPTPGAPTPTYQGTPMPATWTPTPTPTSGTPRPTASAAPQVHTPVAVQTPAVAVAPAPTYKHKGPGRALVSAVLGLILLAVAVVLLFAWGWPNSFALCVGIALVLLGGGIVVAGAMGRSSGVLGFFSIMSMLILVPIGIGTTAWYGFNWGEEGPRTFWTDSTFAPTTAQDATWGVSSATGDSYVDLTQLDLSGTTTATVVPIELGAGQVEILVPTNAAVRVEATMGAGEINLKTTETWNTTWDRTGRGGPWNSGPNRTQSGPYSEESLGGPGVSLTATSPDWKGDDAAGIVLDIQSGAGQIIITEEK